MKKRFLFINAVYIFLFVFGSAYGVGEKTILLGSEAAWNMAEYRAGITEVFALRPYPVLILCSTSGSSAGYSAATGVLGNYSALAEPVLDFFLCFDDRNSGLYRDNTGRYRVTTMPGFQIADIQFAKYGYGTALFGGTPADAARLSSGTPSGSSPLIIEPQSRDALFASGSHIRDFSIEFWLYPFNLENGETVLSWASSIPVEGNYSIQRILCNAYKNRLQWSFVNFFASANGSSYINLEFSGSSPVIPKTWSHHLIRFDATTGMLEYLVDGKSESIVYATALGRENSEVYTPVAGNSGAFLLGEHFIGMMDEFKIHSVFTRRDSFDKYTSTGGRVETKAVDLGGSNSTILRVNASGGRVNWHSPRALAAGTGMNQGSGGTKIDNEFRENGRFRFTDDSEMNFFIRASDNPWLLSEKPWINFTPGSGIPDTVRGRYVQLAIDFYPSADGFGSPYLSELRIVYLSGEPPQPPRNLTASAVDGGVMLNWRASPDLNTSGYLVYYSTVRGELFGDDAALGPSPIDAGSRNSILIDGLKNGTLYYFRLASYETLADSFAGSVNYSTGEFSREVTARPLAGLSITSLPQILEGR